MSANNATTMSRMRSLWIVPLAFLISGCSSLSPYRAYEDKAIPCDQVAKIVGQSPGTEKLGVRDPNITVVVQVDGKRTYPLFFMTDSIQPARDIYVLPGKHNIMVKYQEISPNQRMGNAQPPPSSYAYGDLWLVAEAGKTYTVKVEKVRYDVRFHLEDAEGKVVGGLTGSVDEPKGAGFQEK